MTPALRPGFGRMSGAAGLALLVLVGVAAPASATPRRPDGRAPATVRLIVNTDTAARMSEVAARARGLATDVGVRHAIAALRATAVDVPAQEVGAVAASLRSMRGVTSVELDVRRTFSFVPNDTLYPNQAPYLNAVNAAAAWDVSHGNRSVVVAVIDSGVDVGHGDVGPKVVARYNAMTGSSDVVDEVGHGTFVAGIAGAVTNNGAGVAGVGFGVSLMAVKVGDASGISVADEIAGIAWAADHGADVINISLGSSTPSTAEKNAVNYALGKGIPVVAAAGNCGAGGGECELRNPIGYPAAYPGVIAVGATDAHGHRASFSQYGAWVSVAAPGVRIRSTVPTYSTSIWGTTHNYGYGDGTSFATPIVAGEIALLKSFRPGATLAHLKQAVLNSAHGYAGLGLGRGQVDLRAAFAHLPPVTVPAMTMPIDSSTVSHAVTLTATSTAAAVRFRVDRAFLGAPVRTSGGAASMTWSTWGWANANHVIDAVDCTAWFECSSTVGTSRSVTVANETPVLTEPIAGGAVSGAFVVRANPPVGGGVRFVVNGARKAFDPASGFATTLSGSDYANGSLTLTAQSCDAAETRCAGPVSAPVPVTNSSLHPKFTALAPNPFSPNHDGRKDSIRLTYSLPDDEAGSLNITTLAGSVVRHVNLPGAAGTRSYVWNGKGDDGVVRPSGTYKLVLTTKRLVSGVWMRGSVTAAARIDLLAPTMTSTTGAGSTFYPYPDGYRDSFAPATTLNEPAKLYLNILAGGKVIRTISAARPAGRTSLAWNGRNSANSLVAAGMYQWRFSARDTADNARFGPLYTVIVSSKKLVTRTLTVQQPASAVLAKGGDASCSGWRPSDLFGLGGLWLLNNCDPGVEGPASAYAVYRFTVPIAITYKALRLDGYGTAHDYPSRVHAGFWNYASEAYDFTSGADIKGPTTWYIVGGASTSHRFNSEREINVAVLVTNEYNTDGYPSDFDMKYVRLRVTVAVLA